MKSSAAFSELRERLIKFYLYTRIELYATLHIANKSVTGYLWSMALLIIKVSENRNVQYHSVII